MAVRRFRIFTLAAGLALVVGLAGVAQRAEAQVTALVQSIAESAAGDREIAAFYRDNGYAPLWVTDDHLAKKRRESFLGAVGDASAHGLPAGRYDPASLSVDLRDVGSERELGRLDVEMTRLFLRYAREMQTGILTPSSIDPGIVREVPVRKGSAVLRAFASTSSPSAFIRKLPPQTPEYARLMKEKMRFEALVARGGWGPEVRSRKLEFGQSGPAVVQLRNRLIAMGYLDRTSSPVFDRKMQIAVSQFQEGHGRDQRIGGDAAGADRGGDGAGALDQHAARQAAYLGQYHGFPRAHRR